MLKAHALADVSQRHGEGAAVAVRGTPPIPPLSPPLPVPSLLNCCSLIVLGSACLAGSNSGRANLGYRNVSGGLFF